MRFSTDDGRFGFIVTPVNDLGMFRFQVVIGGQLVGDTEPCILGTAMKQIGKLCRLDGNNPDQVIADPAGALAALRSDDKMHDARMLSLAESLDRWRVFGYLSGENAILLAQKDEGSAVAAVILSVVPVIQYEAIVDAVRTYWSK